jgi:hypothetical protein
MLQRESVDRSLVATFNRAESSNVAEVRKACCEHFSVTSGTCDRFGVVFSRTYNFTSIAVERQLRRQESDRILFLPDYDPPAHVERLPAWQ